MVRTNSQDNRFWVIQEDIVLNQVNPVSGTEYPVGILTLARIISIAVNVEWTVQPTPLELRIATSDGVIQIYRFVNPVTATDYYPAPWAPDPANDQPMDNDAALFQYRPFQQEDKSFEITVETTGGTVQGLNCRVKWARYI